METVLLHLHPDFTEELEGVIQRWNNVQAHYYFRGIRPPKELETNLLTGGAIPANELFKVAEQIRKALGYDNSDGIMIFTEKRIFETGYYQLYAAGVGNKSSLSLDFARNFFGQKRFNGEYIFRAVLLSILNMLAQKAGVDSHDETRGCILDFCNNMPDIVYGIEAGPKFCDSCSKKIKSHGKEYLFELSKAVSNTKEILEQDKVVSKRVVSYEKVRLQEPNSEFKYDIALSFAGEDRTYAEQLANELVKHNIRVFYDGFEKANLWGKDLFVYLSDLYRLRSKYCVLFLSKNYNAKLWTNHERQAAQSRAFKENKEYILPIRLDDTEIPGILNTTGYMSWHEEGAGNITNYLIQKLNNDN